jgi:hypothetical protein
MMATQSVLTFKSFRERNQRRAAPAHIEHIDEYPWPFGTPTQKEITQSVYVKGAYKGRVSLTRRIKKLFGVNVGTSRNSALFQRICNSVRMQYLWCYGSYLPSDYTNRVTLSFGEEKEIEVVIPVLPPQYMWVVDQALTDFNVECIELKNKGEV